MKKSFAKLTALCLAAAVAFGAAGCGKEKKETLVGSDMCIRDRYNGRQENRKSGGCLADSSNACRSGT